MKLNEPDTYPACDQHIEFSEESQQGKQRTVHIESWNDMRLRLANGARSFR